MFGLRGTVAHVAFAMFGASVLWHVAELQGVHASRIVHGIFLGGLFVLGLPTFARQGWLSWSIRTFSPFRGWQLLRGSTPGRLQLVALTTFVYAFVTLFVLARPEAATTADPEIGRVASAAAMAFYSGFALIWTAHPRFWARRWCAEGHEVANDEVRCPRCGNPPVSATSQAGA